jgi:hypothetical protein
MSSVKFSLSYLLLSPLFAAAVVPTGQAFASEVPASSSTNTEVAAPQAMPAGSRGMTQVLPVTQLEGSNAAPTSLQAVNTKKVMGQVTSVSQLSDVQPTDWAFQALQSLVERYGCIAGYPDGTYRGNRPLSRYEFAAGLNACMTRIEELISSAVDQMATKEDLETLKKLQEEFAAELATIRGQVDSLEARSAVLEAQQFSTTTKLNGETIFAVAGVLGSEKALNSDQQRQVNSGSRTRDSFFPGGDNIPENTIFADRVRLNFDTSFTGKDRLRTRLQARNVTPFSGSGITGTNETRLSFDGSEGNSVSISKLEYRFPVGEKLTFYVDAVGGEFNDNMFTFNPLLEGSARGSISRFGRFNPIYRTTAGGDGVGVTFNFKPFEKLTFSGGYFAPTTDAANPDTKNGLFNGTFAAIAQVQFQPVKIFDVGFTYVRAYSKNGSGITGSTGTTFANNPFNGAATSANAFGLQASVKLTPKFTISGWGGYTQAFAEENGVVGVKDGKRADIWNWAVTFAFPDLLKEGNLAAIVFGQPPTVSSNGYQNGNLRREDSSATYHIEAFYRYAFNDNIDVTPGLFVILNPEGNGANNAIFVGTIRTTFRF